MDLAQTHEVLKTFSDLFSIAPCVLRFAVERLEFGIWGFEA